MKRLIPITIATAVAAATASLAVGAPASADRPLEFDDQYTFPEPDPCDGGEMFTTLSFDVKMHDHRNAEMLIVDIAVKTSNGYSGGGRQILVDGATTVGVQTAIVSNTSGDRYKVNSRFVLNPNGIVVDEFDIRCVRDA